MIYEIETVETLSCERTYLVEANSEWEAIERFHFHRDQIKMHGEELFLTLEPEEIFRISLD